MCTVYPPFSPYLAGLAFALPKWLFSRLLSWYFTPEEYNHMIRTKDFVLQAVGYFGTQSTQVGVDVSPLLYHTKLSCRAAFHNRPGFVRLSYRYFVDHLYFLSSFILKGLLVWLGEKYHTRESELSSAYGTTALNCISDVDPEFEIPPEFLISTISIYYHTHTFASSCLPYYENKGMFGSQPARITDSVLGVSVFDHDILIMPKKWVSLWHKKKLVFWKSHARGGHFRKSLLADLLINWPISSSQTSRP
jgi:hypothetical protein